MSYILEALKKAESEREHGTVPGLNTAQSNHSTYIHYGHGARPWWWMLLVLGLLVALVGLLWVWRQPGAEVLRTAKESTDVATQLQSQTLQPQQQSPVPALVAARPPASAPPAASAVAHVLAKAASPAPSSVAPSMPVLHAPAASAPVPVPVPLTGASPKAEPKPTAAVAAAGSRSLPASLPLLHELPDGLRRQIPVMNISGAVFSESPAEWTLIINDQLMGRGSQVTPELRLEDITANNAVFNFKGQRFRVER